MEPPRSRWSDELKIALGAAVGAWAGGGGCLGLALVPALFGSADNLPPPRDAPGMVAAGAAVVGMFVGAAVGALLGYRYAKRRRE
jgi:membrane associated rhomboid family serine protease